MQESVNGAEDARASEGEDEPAAAFLERVKQNHQRDGDEAENGERVQVQVNASASCDADRDPAGFSVVAVARVSYCVRDYPVPSFVGGSAAAQR